MIQTLNEIKLSKGETFKLISNIGNFKKGDKVTIDDIKTTKTDIELHMSNSKGVKDIFYMDTNETI